MPTSSAAVSGPTDWTPDPTTLAAARAEGGLTTIALPPTWCDYKSLLDGFTARTGIAITNLNPDGGSQQELDAVTASKDGRVPGPDVVDVSLASGVKGAAEGLFAPFEVAASADIPATAKDPSGLWYGDYYGVMSFEVNRAVIQTAPGDWADLLSAPQGSVALAGDPTRSNQAVSAVWAAAMATGGSLDLAEPGLGFFKQLADHGILSTTKGTTASVAAGDTPIRLAWTYNALPDRVALAGSAEIDVVIPKTGRLGGMYVQAISAYAAHPNAARLWMSWLYSDEGQLLWLKGYCHPIRYEAMVRANLVPADLAATLPESSGAALPTIDEITTANAVITKGWPTTVGVSIQP